MLLDPKISIPALAAAVALVVSGPAPAATLPALLAPGGSVAVPDFIDGVSLVATQTEAFGGPTGPAGVLTEYVATNSAVNPFGVHALAFAFSLSLSQGEVVRISLPGYAGFGTAVKSCNASACIEGTGDAPDTATRSADGDLVSFLFSTPLTGASSGFVIYTNALSYLDPPSAQIFDLAGDVAFAPVFLPGAVPEPATWALMLLGLAGAGLAVRRRRAPTGA